MNMIDRDKEFVQRIEKALFTRLEINMNEEQGRAYFQPELEDKINPTLTISKDEIRSNTSREKLRKPVIDEYELYFKQHEFIDVQRTGNDALILRTKPVYINKNSFSSMADIERANSQDIIRQQQEEDDD